MLSYKYQQISILYFKKYIVILEIQMFVEV